MNEIKKILAPTDLSAFSVKGFAYAVDLAKTLGAQVIVCHVVRTEEFVGHARLLEKAISAAKVEEQLAQLRDSHRHLLREFIKRHLPPSAQEVVIKEVVEMGEPDELIVNWANDNSVDVIVISTHGRSGLPRMILGSVTEKVLRKSRCPVLAIPCHET